MGSSELRDLVDRLRATSEGFVGGRKGRDFLVFDDGDEMNGYGATPLEESFVDLSGAVRDVLDEDPGVLDFEVLERILESILNSRNAIHAYRCRLFKCATDHGSEISPVSEEIWNLIVSLRNAYRELKAGKIDLLKPLSRRIRKARLELHYYKNWDLHDTKNLPLGEYITADGIVPHRTLADKARESRESQ